MKQTKQKKPHRRGRSSKPESSKYCCRVEKGRIHQEAETDLQHVFIRYEREKEGLGVRFLDRVDEAAGVIARNPEMPQEIFAGLAPCPVEKL